MKLWPNLVQYMEVTAGLPSVTLQGMTSVVPSTGLCVSNACIEGWSEKMYEQIIARKTVLTIGLIKSLKLI